MDASLTVIKPRAPRKPKAKLPPAVAHELDIMRAARMGVDISYMAVDERCKYPSKFCCNARARKSTGKLHRFCEEHRSRANVNQKRWTEIRRRHADAQDVVAHSLALCDDDSWDQVCAPLLAFAGLPVPFDVATPRKQGDWLAKSQPSSPTNVDTLYEDDLPLSEDDIDTLTSIVAHSERSVEVMTTEDAWLMAMLHEVEAPVVTSNVFDELAIGAL